jgi:hypothetical protein
MRWWIGGSTRHPVLCAAVDAVVGAVFDEDELGLGVDKDGRVVQANGRRPVQGWRKG